MVHMFVVAAEEIWCKDDTAISGTSDVWLSNGKAGDLGFSQAQCAAECKGNKAYASFVWAEERCVSII